MNSTAKLWIARILYTIAVFLITLLITSRVINRSPYEVSTSMSRATLPLVHVVMDGQRINTMHGYAQEMDVASMRGPLVVAGTDRSFEILIDTYNQRIEDVQFELRTTDGLNLIEVSPVQLMTEITEEVIEARVTAKDLIEYDREYMLALLLKVRSEGSAEIREVRYYTRLICTTDEDLMHVRDHLSFVRAFHDNTFDAPSRIRPYLETTKEGQAAASLTDTDIHASLERVTWEGLEITKRTEPQIEICDLHNQTASVSIRYNLTLTEDGREISLHVCENYFTRYSAKEMYLIDYRRTAGQIFSGEKEDLSADAIELGYAHDDVQMTESDGGGCVAFVNEGRLYVYQIAENRLTQAFGFFDTTDEDVRTGWQGIRINILQADEAGNVLFTVTGYMNRGRHEGRVGTLVCSFHAAENVREDLVFLPSPLYEEVLKAQTDTVSFVSNRGIYYCVPGNDLCAIDLYEGNARTLEMRVATGNYLSSAEHAVFAWQDSVEAFPDRIRVMDLRTEKARTIRAEEENCIRLLGFIGEDIVYGWFREEAAGADTLGTMLYPMHRIVIEDIEGNVLNTYEAGASLVSAIRFDENRMVLQLTTRQGDVYVSAGEDQIMRTEAAEAYRNVITGVQAALGTRMRIVLKEAVDREKCKHLTAQEMLSDVYSPETGAQETGERYYCYDHRQVKGIYTEAGYAVSAAYACYGQAVDETGRYIYYRGQMTTRNQIMSLTNAVEQTDYSSQSSVAVCLKAMLDYEGVGRNVQALMTRGETPQQILSEALTGARVLALDGCPMAAMLYYVDLMCDYPVMGYIGDDDYVLLLGFNEYNVVLFNPKRAENNVYKIGISDAAELFAAYGNHFLTYVK